jgi:uracil-DNA glycosylase family 4
MPVAGMPPVHPAEDVGPPHAHAADLKAGKSDPVSLDPVDMDPLDLDPVDLEVGRDCPRCPRLVAFRYDLRKKQPDWHNAPVPSFGPVTARLLVVGLAPGMQGANRTGRPFTGDFAGDLLYATLARFGFTAGAYTARPDDSLCLVDARITNAVRCVPPENKPAGEEIRQCRDFLKATIAGMPNLAVLVLLGRIAHDSAVKALGLSPGAVPFSHGAKHPAGRMMLFDSYHCSRYNTNTGVLTPEMFETVFAAVRRYLDSLGPPGAAAAVSPSRPGKGKVRRKTD